MVKHLPRWLKASVSYYFNQQIGDQLHLFIEGMKRDTNEYTSYAELRMDGPFIIERTSGIFKVRIDINILVETLKDNRYMYAHETNMGIVADAFSKNIEINKLGNNRLDDQTFVDCLYLEQGTKDPLAIYNIGPSRPGEEVFQGQVEGHYVNYDFNMERLVN